MKKTVIVCGMPRSGTRSVANILNTSKSVYVTAEFPSGVTSKMFQLIDSMTGFFGKRAYKDKSGWASKKSDLVHDVWLANSLFDGNKSDYEVIGNKTPSNELFFDKFESVFEDNKPYYIYCVRNPVKVITSLANMPWNKETPMENWERWKLSFDTYLSMRESAPGRVLLVSFDDKVDGSFLNIGLNIFNFIGVSIGEQERKNWSESRPAQPKESVLNGRSAIELNDDVIRSIKADTYSKFLEKEFPYLIS